MVGRGGLSSLQNSPAICIEFLMAPICRFRFRDHSLGTELPSRTPVDFRITNAVLVLEPKSDPARNSTSYVPHPNNEIACSATFTDLRR